MLSLDLRYPRERVIVRISAVICTFRRTDVLPEAIESLLSQSLPPEQYEVIVVDNNSQDETAEIVKRYARQGDFPRVRYALEIRQGLSHARNTGLRLAEGEVAAFIDDDAIAEKDWLAALVEAFQQKDPSPVCVGGKVLPVWEVDRPAWLPDSLVGYLGLLDYGGESRVLDYPAEHLIGCNMAFRRGCLFDKTGGFDPCLGRKGRDLAGGEETALLHEIHKRDGVIYYEARAVVHHVVQAQRLTRKWFLRRFWDEGISFTRAQQRRDRQRPVLAITRHLEQALTAIGFLSRSVVVGNVQKQTLYLARLAFESGAILQTISGIPGGKD